MAHNLMTWLFFTQPFRRWMVRLYRTGWLPTRLNDRLLDRLYPDDCFVTFGGEHER